MATRLSIKEVAANEGVPVDNLLEEYVLESVVPACCSEGCEVEPDGTCPHGYPSIMLALGVI